MLSRRLCKVLGLTATFVAVFALFLGRPVVGDTTDWTELFRATFTGVPDGSGDGHVFPCEIGKLTVLAPLGKGLGDLSPNSGIESECFSLTDSSAGMVSPSDFGIHVAPTSDALYGAAVSFALRMDADGSAFGGDVSDGTTSDMCDIRVYNGVVFVNGSPMQTHLKTGTWYRFDEVLVDDPVAPYYMVVLTNLDTGDAEIAVDTIDGGWRPAHALDLFKPAGTQGSFSVDSIEFYGLQH